MAKGRRLVRREWVHVIEPDVAQRRCRFERDRKQVLRFAVQLELKIEGYWLPAIRCDNAHGFCHLDTLHLDGASEKTPTYKGDVNATFTWAQTNLGNDWKLHLARFESERKS